MSAPARVSRREAPAARRGGRARPVAGLGVLFAFMLRRDRLRGPSWVLGVTAFAAYFSNAVPAVMDDESLAGMAILAQNPIMGLITGPGYGLDDITLPRFIVGMYGVFLMLAAAMMSITTISRHTRAEEQTGRAELIRANATGRHTQLVAALLLALAMNAVLAALVAVTFQFSGAEPEPWTSSALFGASIGAVGVVFAAVAAVTAQLSAYSRAGSGAAGAVLGAAFVVRGIGDMSAIAGGGLDKLSWLSPLGWAQATAPFTLDRWWPLAWCAVLAVALVPCAVALQSRRDLAAGLLPDRLGRPSAPAGLRGPFSLALRLQRTSLVWWSIAVALTALIFGAFTGAMRDGAAEMPPAITQLLGDADEMVDGYVGYMALFFALLVGAYAIMASAALRAEETDGRAEPVLATAAGRPAWSVSWTIVAAGGALWLMLVAGAGVGVGAAATVGDAGLIPDAIAGAVAQTPAVWALLALSAALYGWAPRLMGLTWAVYAISALLALFGQLLKIDEAVLDASVFRLIGQYPAADLDAVPIAVLTTASVVGVALGTLGFRRRDLAAT